MTTLLNSAKQAALKFAAKSLKEGYQFNAVHVYTNAAGEPIYWRIRLDNPVTGEKWIRPMHYDGKNYKLSEPKFEDKKPLYNLQNLANNPNEPVFICEGERCVDALVDFCLLSTTSGSADSASTANWAVLAGRTVIIWPDNDEAGKRYAESIIAILRELQCTIKIINIDLLKLPSKGDVIDWLAANPKATTDNIKSLPIIDIVTLSANTNDSNNSDQQEKQQSQASILVAFVETTSILFHDLNKDVYAQDLITKETRRLESRQFRDWLVASFYQTTGKSPREQSLREALSTLSGLARFRGECHEVFIRVAQHDDIYYLDLAEAGDSRVVEIKPNSWKIISDPPVRFVRPENLRPLPEPKKDGDLLPLWSLMNIPDDAKLLVVAWLAECLRPDTPFPILELIGEQGSAKSTTQTMLRRLIDPNACDLRAAPKTVEDVFVSAGVNWLTSYENISHLSPQMQDALCILSTGGGFAKRKLYSDADESVINVKRPIVLNGISAAITAQDLIDRAISVEMPIIDIRSETTNLWRTYEELHSSLLGGLLNIVVDALARLPHVQLPAKGHCRLIEFFRLGIAIAEAMEQSGDNFCSQFNVSRQESIARTIDASPVATALIDWFDKRYRQAAEMPAKQLFDQVSNLRPSNTDAWPRSAKGFADALRRSAPALRQLGIECRSLGKIGSHVLWEVKQKE